MRCVVGVVLAVDEGLRAAARGYRGNNLTTELNREIFYYKGRELLRACKDAGCCARAVISGVRLALDAEFDSRRWLSVSWCQYESLLAREHRCALEINGLEAPLACGTSDLLKGLPLRALPSRVA